MSTSTARDGGKICSSESLDSEGVVGCADFLGDFLVGEYPRAFFNRRWAAYTTRFNSSARPVDAMAMDNGSSTLSPAGHNARTTNTEHKLIIRQLPWRANGTTRLE